MDRISARRAFVVLRISGLGGVVGGALAGVTGGAARHRSQLGPDRLPVVRAQILARDLAAGFAFDRHAVFGAGLAVRIAVLPLPDLCVTLDADALGELSYREGAIA